MYLNRTTHDNNKVLNCALQAKEPSRAKERSTTTDDDAVGDAPLGKPQKEALRDVIVPMAVLNTTTAT